MPTYPWSATLSTCLETLSTVSPSRRPYQGCYGVIIRVLGYHENTCRHVDISDQLDGVEMSDVLVRLSIAGLNRISVMTRTLPVFC